MLLPISTAEAFGYLAGAFNLTSLSMRRMIPLRAAGIAANCAGISYGILSHAHPAVILNCILLPLNITRLVQMIRLVRNVQTAASAKADSIEWIRGFMKSRRYTAGQVMFRKGEEATALFYIVSGRFYLPEISVSLTAGELIGELGIVSPGNRRTQTVVCAESGVVLTVTYDQVRQLYFQNPKFGFYLLQLIGERMNANVERARQIGA